LRFAGALLILFIVAPVAGIFINASGASLFDTATDRELLGSVWLTIWISMLGTLLLSVPAILFAHLLAKGNLPLPRLLNALVDIPIIIPHPAAGIALLGVISRDTLVGRVADKCGISFVGHPAGIMVAMAFVSVPYLVNAARDGFATVPVRFEKAALALGASPWRVFATISVPLAWRAILSGMVMMFARGLSEFGAVIVIAYHPMVTPILIYERFTSFGLGYAQGATALFVCVCLLVFVLLRFLSSGGRRHAEG